MRRRPALAVLACAALAIAARSQDPERPVPGDEGPLRKGAFLPVAPEAVQQRLAGAEEAFESGNVSSAFAALRQCLLDARDSSGAPLLVGVDRAADHRLYMDVSTRLRAGAAELAGAALATYRTDVDPAAAMELSTAVAIPDIVARAGRFPRTDAAVLALSRVAGRLMERGDTCGARAAIARVLESGAGSAQERAAWFLLERGAALETGAGSALAPSAAELDATVALAGASVTLREALGRIAGDPSELAAGAVRERWRVPAPASSRPGGRSTPFLRAAAEAGGSVLVSGGGALVELDGSTGATRSRAALPATAKRPERLAPRRREGPSSDGRFVAITHDGSLSVFELTPAGLAMRWTKADDDAVYADGPLVVGGRVFAASLAATSETAISLDGFDAASGERTFRRFLAKGGAVGTAERGAASERAEIVAPEPLAFAGGRVVVATELGVVAVVDPLDGEVEYALRTQRSREPGAYQPSAPQGASWFVAAPSDSDFVYALEPRAAAAAARGGSKLPFAFDRAPLARATPASAAFARLVGVDGSRAMFLDRKRRLDRTHELRSFDFAERRLDDVELAPGEEPLGWPAIVGRGLYLATDHGLTTIALEKDLRPVTCLPAGGGVPASELLGDLTPVSGGVVSVSRDWIVRFDVVR